MDILIEQFTTEIIVTLGAPVVAYIINRLRKVWQGLKTQIEALNLDLTNKIHDLQDENKKLRTDVTSLKADNTRLTRELDSTNKKLDEVLADYHQVSVERDKAKEALELERKTSTPNGS